MSLHWHSFFPLAPILTDNTFREAKMHSAACSVLYGLISLHIRLRNMQNKNHIVITDIVIVSCYFFISQKNNDQIFAGVGIKQVCSLMSAEYDLWAGAARCFIYKVRCDTFYLYQKTAAPAVSIIF